MCGARGGGGVVWRRAWGLWLVSGAEGTRMHPGRSRGRSPRRRPARVQVIGAPRMPSLAVPLCSTFGAAEGRPSLGPGTFEKAGCGEAAPRLFESSRPESAMNLFDTSAITIAGVPRQRRF